ncbi:MAG: hypothetical protein QOH12_864 [Solirubrobacteraceae bacterium]|jgi:hypothetical protein|nr:hypothetical protein [Solirubrobacteraceae bacterium]
MTPSPGRRRPRSVAGAASVTLALFLAGCAGDRSDPPRAPATLPTVVATAITPGGVTISPDHLGAGPVALVITNMTAASQELAVHSSQAGSFHQETAPINPQDTAQLQAQLTPGSYTVSVRAPGLKSASLAVGRRPTGSP